MLWAAVVEEIRNGDERGAEMLYSAVSDCARAQLFLSVDPQAVDDHLQEVLIIVSAAIRSGALRDPNCLLAFVRTVTKRQVVTYIRGAVVRRSRASTVDSAHPLVAPARESPEERLVDQQRTSTGRDVLLRLCPRDREILVRFYFDEEDSETICREMTLTATQFRLYKSRALAKCNEWTDRAQRIQEARHPYATRPARIA